jgi:hypothetical protein
MFSRVAELPREYLEAGGPSRVAVGAESFDLLEETYRLEADGEHDSTAQKVLIQLIRCLILEPLLHLALLSYVGHVPTDPLAPEFRAALDRMIHRTNLMEKWEGQGQRERWRELARLAHQLDESSAIASGAIVLANDALLSDPKVEGDEALRLVRESIAYERMIAAMDPGTFNETYLVMDLRREGRLCNDLGRSDEATRAFARADEIIDRYPVADPGLVFPGVEF